jgi:cytochrome c556
MRLSKLVPAAVVAALLGAGVATFVVAADTDPVKARHDAMEQVGSNMKTLGGMARGQAPFDAAVVATSAKTIKARLDEAAALFPPGSDQGETKARPEIWSDRATFDKIMMDAQAAAAALAEVKEETAFRPAMGALGQNCKGCHDKFRMPDQH